MPSSSVAYVYITIYDPFPFPSRTSNAEVDGVLLSGETKSDPAYVLANQIIAQAGGRHEIDVSISPTSPQTFVNNLVPSLPIVSFLIPNYDGLDSAISLLKQYWASSSNKRTLSIYSLDSDLQFHPYTAADAGTFDYAHWSPPLTALNTASLIGTAQNDRLSGTSGNDTLQGLQGNDTIDGGAGIDTALYAGNVSSYTISRSGSTITVADKVTGRDGTDTLVNVEQLKFSDVEVVLDLNSPLDRNAYLLYQAAFARMPDQAGFRFWAGLSDANAISLPAMAQQFIGSAEFQQKYGSPDNTAFVTALYTNVLGRAPDPSGVDYWVGRVAAGETRAQALIDFALSSENIQMTGSHTANGFWVSG